ncbi:MAG: FAD-dependent oxidoreductase [Hyphomicrobiaceae bacterium]|nr:FAD-dependent oxidoreductase [Hyphomicrobiaceae bacterium]
MTGAAALDDKVDVAVIGAGPAGLAAGALSARAGLATVVLDENPAPGGQIYRAITTTPVQRKEILGTDYWHGRELVRELESSGARLATGATVWSISRDLEVAVSHGGRAHLLHARRIVIATGALERPFPVPGWTLPGVMTAGGAQTLLKSSGLVPEGRVVLAGTGPLLWLLAAQLLRAGGAITAILDTTPRQNYVRALRHAPAFVLSPYLIKGLRMMAEVRRKVRVISGVTRLEAVGEGKLKEIIFATGNGAAARMAADLLLLHQGVVPNVNLAMSIGIVHRWDGLQLCWVPEIDRHGNSSVPDIAIAGDGAGIGGAVAAAERGRLAAIAAVRALAPAAVSGLPAEQAVMQALAKAEAGRAFLDTLYQPSADFRIPAGDDTIVCRCEEVTAGQIRANVALGCEGPNQMKSFLRCGMGPCQGRLCGLTVTETIAAARGVSPAQVGYYRLRPPVKPIPLAEVAAMPQPESAVKAVVRR